MNRPALLLRRIHLLNKRFLKTPVFILLLLLLPLSAFLLNKASDSKDIGLKVGYAISPSADDYTLQAVSDSFADGGLVKYSKFSSESQIVEALYAGNISMGFVIPPNLQESFREFEKGKSVKKQMKVIVKKNTVVTRLITELFFGKLFSRVSCQITKNYIASMDSSAFKSEADGQTFEKIYEANRPKSAVFIVEYSDTEGESVSKPVDVPLLASPIRGLSSIFLLLLGFAAAFYYIRDEKNGLFVWFPKRSKIFLRIFYIFLPIFDASLVMFASLYFSGSFTSWVKEVPLLFVYSLGAAAFCSFFCAVFNDEALLAGVVPLVLLATFVICPVFISINAPALLQKIFPPYVYLMAIHKSGGMLDMLTYTAIAFIAAITASLFRINSLQKS
ncbi:MAG: hypothetical protein J5817_10350 [Treponema sp.]|nr:hypothetical protein [Treponema sp.]